MFERFKSVFSADTGISMPVWRDDALLTIRGYRELMEEFAGRSFDGGLYRLHSAVSGPVGQELVSRAFPEFAGRVRVFGFDWMGRQAAADFGRVDSHGPMMLVLEPGAGEALEIPVGFEWFHDEEMVDFRNELLASDFFAQWRESNRVTAPLRLDQCVGYRLPLFLGGSDTTDNLEISDFEVYWDFAGQLRKQSLEFPLQTGVRRVIPEK